MMNHEQATRDARTIIASRSTEAFIADFEITNAKKLTLELATVRGWIMDELEKRNKAAFEAWIDSDDESPRKHFEIKRLNSICHRCKRYARGECKGTTNMI